MRLIAEVGSPACPVSELTLDREVPFLRHGILEIPLEVIQSGIRRNVTSRTHARKRICESDVRHVRRSRSPGKLRGKRLTDPQGPRWIECLASGAHQTRLEIVINAVPGANHRALVAERPECQAYSRRKVVLVPLRVEKRRPDRLCGFVGIRREQLGQRSWRESRRRAVLRQHQLVVLEVEGRYLLSSITPGTLILVSQAVDDRKPRRSLP